MTSTMQLARAEREEFASLLEGLTPQQWDSPTLCDRWRVRDVVAHAIGYDPLTRRQLLGLLAKGLFTSGGANAVGVAAYADTPPSELLSLVRRYAEPRGLTAGFGGKIALTDGMIHQQDIRRPLGIPRTIDQERLLVALDFTLWAPRLLGAVRSRGFRLDAVDVNWSHGKGPEVRGPGEALLMAMAGRRAALDDLDGPGKTQLAQRL
ncbi:maleylpyruvate isomerase family mycothiol-dependent enzyme [Mycobacterium deserti]|uniref:Maleylpyruvate isomerase family mycothiol-dependent enzyme n=1 Tax=Mycobacterium deserti TaxID=2978347 RepID=A0ABT2MFW2_9MYCO|nr:maleylpyruvate isomerase family mycothiol-dependent enzyme [Mycobacterium deserti]MCT7660414.1 maleylpyruvate isomerase family mycothiol-dependent enzyme [Mycobacterium deserti]